MAKVSPYQGDFGGGEFSPLYYGRANTERYKTALAKCLNYIPTSQGGLVRRSGTQYIAPTRYGNSKVKHVPYDVSQSSKYMVEIGRRGGNFASIRFHLNGAPLLDANTTGTITAITQANPGVVTSVGHPFVNDDELEIRSVVGMTELNNRRFRVGSKTANNFQLLNLDGTNFNTTSLTAYASGGTATEVLEIYSGASGDPRTALYPLYLESELADIQFAQSGTQLFLVHPNHEPVIVDIVNGVGVSYAGKFRTFTNSTSPLIGLGPFVNGDANYTLTPAAISGATTVTSSGATTFVADDIGRTIGIKQSGVWGYATITAWTSGSLVSVTVISNFANTTASAIWEMTAWSETTGYPSSVCFHEGRAFFGGIRDLPLRVDGSATGEYFNFSPHGTTASDPLSFTLASRNLDAVRWIATDEKGLLVGTSGNEWIIRPSTLQEALTATNVKANPSSGWGSDSVAAIQVGKAAVYVQSSGKKVRELTYNYDVDGFKSDDLTTLGEHMTGTGVSQLCHQKEPQSIVWMVREDGYLIGVTYERTGDGIRAGWHKHLLGGVSDAAGSPPVVEGVQTLPSSDGSRSEVWLVVKRYINGATVRHVEILSKIFDDLDEQREGFFVDSGLTYDAPKTITSITKANPAVVTSTAHGFSNGDSVWLSNLVGMTTLNDRRFTVANQTANTFELSGENSTAYTTYVSGGVARKFVSTVTGLWHLEGESVSVCGDGAVQPNKTVTSGTITLATNACTVHAGYNYNSDGQMLRLDAGAADGTSIGKTRRAHRVAFMFHRTLGFKFGVDFDSLQTIVFRNTSDDLSQAVPLFSGIKTEELESDYDFENQICWRQDQPLPGIILAVAPQQVTQDR